MLVIGEVDLIGGFASYIDLILVQRELNDILNIRPLNYAQRDLVRFGHIGLELVGAHLHNNPL